MKTLWLWVDVLVEGRTGVYAQGFWATGNTPEEVIAEIRERSKNAKEWRVVGLHNNRRDYEAVFGAASKDCKFKDDFSEDELRLRLTVWERFLKWLFS